MPCISWLGIQAVRDGRIASVTLSRVEEGTGLGCKSPGSEGCF